MLVERYYKPLVRCKRRLQDFNTNIVAYDHIAIGLVKEAVHNVVNAYDIPLAQFNKNAKKFHKNLLFSVELTTPKDKEGRVHLGYTINPLGKILYKGCLTVIIDCEEAAKEAIEELEKILSRNNAEVPQTNINMEGERNLKVQLYAVKASSYDGCNGWNSWIIEDSITNIKKDAEEQAKIYEELSS